jgi:hypothetical protein
MQTVFFSPWKNRLKDSSKGSKSKYHADFCPPVQKAGSKEWCGNYRLRTIIKTKNR